MPSRASATSAAPLAAIQRSAGIVFIHSMSAKPASSGAAKAIPHPSSVERTSCHGRTMAPASGANSAMTLMIARNTRTSASRLAQEAGAQDERGRLPTAPRGPAPRGRASSRGHRSGQTSITIGRIIGRRLVRWWKKRLSVSRDLRLHVARLGAVLVLAASGAAPERGGRAPGPCSGSSGSDRNPRLTRSGRPTGWPVLASTVRATITTPSEASMRRSRRTTPSMPSMAAMPSTRTAPAVTVPAIRARSPSNSTTWPFSSTKILSTSTPAPSARSAVLHEHAVLAVDRDEVAAASRGRA